MSEIVPTSLTERPKQGFGVPLEDWLRGSLRDWAESLLDRRKLEEEATLDADTVRDAWQQFLDGAGGAGGLWNVLMFQAWATKRRSD